METSLCKGSSNLTSQQTSVMKMVGFACATDKPDNLYYALLISVVWFSLEILSCLTNGWKTKPIAS